LGEQTLPGIWDQVGWELMNIHDNGGNFVIGPFVKASTLWNFNPTIRMACSGGNGANPNVAETGFAQALVNGWISPTKPTFSETTVDSFNASSDPNIGGYSIDDPNKIASGANGALTGALFAGIMKAWFPQPDKLDLERDYSNVGGLLIPAGGFIVVHADHTGEQADWEAQIDFGYTINP
jgi:hypothetical protein